MSEESSFRIYLKNTTAINVRAQGDSKHFCFSLNGYPLNFAYRCKRFVLLFALIHCGIIFNKDWWFCVPCSLYCWVCLRERVPDAGIFYVHCILFHHLIVFYKKVFLAEELPTAHPRLVLGRIKEA